MRFLTLTLACLTLTLACVSLSAQDMSLATFVDESAPWELVSEGHGFTDGACADEAGNFYFSDVRTGSNIYKVDLDRKVSIYATNAPGISGMKWGADGKLYACQYSGKVVLRREADGQWTKLAENVDVNDLAVTKSGFIYFSSSAKRVQCITPDGTLRVADTGINSPNGLTLSPDHGTLIVTDYNGRNLWAFRVETNGLLTAKSPYCETRTPSGKEASGADGMCTDIAGRYYVASEVGFQVFDPTGRMCGVINKPNRKFTANLYFAGKDHSYLYVVAADSVYRRRMNTRGAR